MTRTARPMEFSDGFIGTRFMLMTESRDEISILFRKGRMYMFAKDGDTGNAATLVFSLRDVADFAGMVADAMEAFEHVNCTKPGEAHQGPCTGPLNPFMDRG